jgi:hypothetical protein
LNTQLRWSRDCVDISHLIARNTRIYWYVKRIISNKVKKDSKRKCLTLIESLCNLHVKQYDSTWRDNKDILTLRFRAFRRDTCCTHNKLEILQQENFVELIKMIERIRYLQAWLKLSVIWRWLSDLKWELFEEVQILMFFDERALKLIVGLA